MMWIVSWVVSVWVSAPCPDYKPDPYTGEYPLTACLVYHGSFEDKKMEKLFESECAAEEFINNAPDGMKFKLMKVKNKKP